MQHRSVVVTGVVFILVMVMHALTVSTAHGQMMTITQARQQQPGTVVSVQGWVTVPSGAFSSATFDQGFAMEDSHAGIYVRVAIDLGLDLDQKVRVTGRVDTDGFGLLILVPQSRNDVEVLSGSNQVDPQPFTTCEIGDATEGSLVLVIGEVTRPIDNDLPFGYKVFIDGSNNGSCELQVFIHASTGINPHRIPFIRPNKIIQVTGFSGEFTVPGTPQKFEVAPRIASDILEVQ